MAEPLAQLADVEAVWRPVVDAQQVAQVSHLILLASAKVRALVTNLDARTVLPEGDALRLDPVLVAGVVANIVKRVLVNPDGLQSSTRTVGPYSESQTHGASEPRGLVVTPEDLAELLPRGSGGARTLTLGLSDRMLADRRYRLRYFDLPRP